MCLLPRTICFSRPVSLSASKSSPPFAHTFVPHSSKHTCSGCSGCCVNTSALSSPRVSHVGSFSRMSHDRCAAINEKAQTLHIKRNFAQACTGFEMRDYHEPRLCTLTQQQSCLPVLLSMDRKRGVRKIIR